MAQIHREEDFARNDVAAVGPVFEKPDGRDTRQMRHAHLVNGFDHPRRTEQRILAQLHRRGAGMGVLAPDRHFVPAHALHSGDDADHLVLGFEYRSLFDVELEHRLELLLADGIAAAIADACEFVAEVAPSRSVRS